jgi:hypothetical protein
MYGRDAAVPRLLQDPDFTAPATMDPAAFRDFRAEVTARLQCAWVLARRNIQDAQATMKALYDAHSTDCAFLPGDRIWLSVPHFRKSRKAENSTAVAKFAARWTGPHRIESIHDNGLTLHCVEILSPTEVIRRIAHVNRARHYTARVPIGPEPAFDEADVLAEEYALLQGARVLKNRPFRPNAHGISDELLRRRLYDSPRDLHPDEFEVEEVVAHRDLVADAEGPAGRWYLVKWKHYTAADNSWLPQTELLTTAPEAVQAYEARLLPVPPPLEPPADAATAAPAAPVPPPPPDPAPERPPPRVQPSRTRVPPARFR